MADLVSRRRFLAVSGAALSLPVLAACGGGGGSTTAASCEGYDALTPQDIQTRTGLSYVDVSPYPDKLCSNCQLYNQPVGGSACGGCQLFAGPVAPGGHCASWVAAAA